MATDQTVSEYPKAGKYGGVSVRRFQILMVFPIATNEVSLIHRGLMARDQTCLNPSVRYGGILSAQIPNLMV